MLDVIFTRLFFIMRLSMIFVILLFCGGFIFGLSPALATILSLYHNYKTEAEQYTYSEAFEIFKKLFLQSNLVLLSIIGLQCFLSYGIYLLLQMEKNFFTLLLSIFNSLLFIYVYFIYTIYLKLQIYYEFNFLNGLKLSAMVVFFSLISLLKLLVGTIICVFVMWKVSIIIGIFLPVIWLMFLYDVLEPIYHQLDAKMEI